MPAGQSPTTGTDSVESELARTEALAAEFVQRMVDCLNDAGWTATVEDDGTGMSVEEVQGPDDAAFQQARADCEEQAGPRPSPPPLTDEVIRLGFEDLLEVGECLTEAGYPVPDPPSVESYVDNFESNPWHPYDAIPDGQLDSAMQACPQ